MSFFDAGEESLDSGLLWSLQRRKLARLFEAIAEDNAFYARKIATFGRVPTLDDLPAFPLTTRDELLEDQARTPPYGTNLTYPVSAYRRVHQTSGSRSTPLRWLDTIDSWAWCRRCWGSIFRAGGLTDDDRVMFPFSFGPFIGFWLAFECASEMGNFCLPAGGMTTAARLRYLLDHRVTFVTCTPTYALRMGEVASREGVDLASSPVRALIVAGEPGGSIPATRSAIETVWGARVLDHAGMTEIGAWGFECVERPGGMHVLENEFIAEVIDPATGEAVVDGEVGELVLTNLGRLGSPLIRYRTGDRVRLQRGRCACGRSFAWAEGGILGRSDDMLVIRGNNVFPSAIEGIVRTFPGVVEFRIKPVRRRSMLDLEIEIEFAAGGDAGSLGPEMASRRISEALRDRLHFKPSVTIVPPGTLPRFEMKANRIVPPEPAEGSGRS